MTGKRDNDSRADAPKALTLRHTRKLGKILRETREALGLTREQVRDATGLSTVSQYWAESGERPDDDGNAKRYRLQTQTLVTLARLLKLTPLQLAECNRADAAALLRTATLPGDLTEKQRTDIASAMLTLRRALPDFASMVQWVGTATGDLPVADDAPAPE